MAVESITFTVNVPGAATIENAPETDVFTIPNGSTAPTGVSQTSMPPRPTSDEFFTAPDTAAPAGSSTSAVASPAR